MSLRLATFPCLLALAACSDRSSEAGSQAPAAQVSTPDALFGFETREYQLYLHPSADGFEYTVKSLEGRVLAERIGEAELEASYPALHEVLNGGVDLKGIGY